MRARVRPRPPAVTNGGPLVVIRAGTSWDATRLADQHLALHLARHCQVLYVDPPLSRRSPRHDPRLQQALREPWLRTVAPGVIRLSPRVPPGTSRRLARVTEALVQNSMRHALRALGRREATALVTVAASALGGVPADRRIFWARDDYLAGASLMGRSERRLRRAEARVCRLADTVVVVSTPLAGKWRDLGFDPVLIPNGCDVVAASRARDAHPAEDVDLPRPIIGFVGTLSERIDLEMLTAIAETGHSLLLVGAKQKTFDRSQFEAVIDRSNVRWLGARPYDELARYHATMDVGVVPYVDSMFNRASFPLKVLEYLAAGLPVVSSRIPAIAELGCPDVILADDPAAMVKGVQDALDVASEPEFVARRQQFARAHDWSHCASRFLRLLGLPEGQVPLSAPVEEGLAR